MCNVEHCGRGYGCESESCCVDVGFGWLPGWMSRRQAGGAVKNARLLTADTPPLR